MKKALMLLIGVSVAAGAQYANAASFQFITNLQVDNKQVLRADIDIPEGETIMLTISSGLRMEISAPAGESPANQTQVRLFDVSKGEPIELHASRSSEPSSYVRTVTYSICKGQAAFTNSPSAPFCK